MWPPFKSYLRWELGDEPDERPDDLEDILLVFPGHLLHEKLEKEVAVLH